jgi:hypothetical protein
MGMDPGEPRRASASPPKVRRRVITPPAIADARALLAAVDELDVDFSALLRVLTATGDRRGEVCGLTPLSRDADRMPADRNHGCRPDLAAIPARLWRSTGESTAQISVSAGGVTPWSS